MAEAKRYRVRVDSEIEDLLTDAVTSLGYDNESEALRELARAGYHERKHPAIYRLRNAGVQGAYLFAMLAFAVIPFGYLTDAFTSQQAWYLFWSFLLLALFVLSVTEGVRLIGRWL